MEVIRSTFAIRNANQLKRLILDVSKLTTTPAQSMPGEYIHRSPGSNMRNWWGNFSAYSVRYRIDDWKESTHDGPRVQRLFSLQLLVVSQERIHEYIGYAAGVSQ